MKRCIKVLILCAISISILVSCGTTSLSTNTTINIDGSSETVIRVAYDNIIKAFVRESLLSMALKDEDVEVNEYTEGDLTIEEATIKTDKISYKDLGKVNENEKLNQYFNYDIDVDKGLLINKYTITASLKDNVMSEVNEYVDSYSSSLSGTLLDSINQNVKSYLNSITYDFTLTIPFDFEDSNATVVNGNTATWNMTLEDLTPSTEINFSFNAPNIVNIIIAAAILIILIIVIIVILIISRKKSKR